MEAAGGPRAARKNGGGGLIEGFSPVSPPRIYWNSRKRSANGRSLEKVTEEESRKAKEEGNGAAGDSGGKLRESPVATDDDTPMAADGAAKENPKPELSDRRRALFEPLGPVATARVSNEDLLPPPDFDAASYPKGWLVGKKRKLVNVDVVESMRRIAVQEMDRKDREIDGLNEQLEEDSRCLEHLQVQLLEERRKRADVERENAVLQNQISMLMSMLQDADAGEAEDDGIESPPEDS